MRLGIQSVPLALTDNRHRYQLREVTSLHSDQVDYLKQSKGSRTQSPKSRNIPCGWFAHIQCSYLSLCQLTLRVWPHPVAVSKEASYP